VLLELVSIAPGDETGGVSLCPMHTLAKWAALPHTVPAMCALQQKRGSAKACAHSTHFPWPSSNCASAAAMCTAWQSFYPLHGLPACNEQSLPTGPCAHCRGTCTVQDSWASSHRMGRQTSVQAPVRRCICTRPGLV
jgi:hypothetical protein